MRSPLDVASLAASKLPDEAKVARPLAARLADTEVDPDAEIRNTPEPTTDADGNAVALSSLTRVALDVDDEASPAGFASPVLTRAPLLIDDDAVLDVP